MLTKKKKKKRDTMSKPLGNLKSRRKGQFYKLKIFQSNIFGKKNKKIIEVPNLQHRIYMLLEFRSSKESQGQFQQTSCKR